MHDYYYYRPKSHEDTHTVKSSLDKPERPRRHYKKWILVSLGLLVLVLALVLLLGYAFLRFTPLANDDGRTNILILGVDEVADLSDTIMLVSIDGIDQPDPQVAMVSIPRDLYLSIPDYGQQKINAAYSHGENTDHPGGGAALSAETIEHNFDIPVHYYATLDFEGFETIIDTLGGVDVEVEAGISDPYYPAPGYNGYDPFTIEAGEHHMDGELALKYARSRQTTSDFDRAYRQQQVVMAVQERIFNGGLLTSPESLMNLADTVDEHMLTDMDRLEMAKLGLRLRGFDLEGVDNYVLDNTNLLVSQVNETGSALVPRNGDFSEIKRFLEGLFDQDTVDQYAPRT